MREGDARCDLPTVEGSREPGSQRASTVVRRGRAEQHTWAPAATGDHRWPQVATGSKGTYLELVNKCDRGARLSRANGSPHAHEPASHHHDILYGARGGGGGSGGGGGKAACRTTAHVGAGCDLGGGAGDAAKCTGTDLRDAMHCKSMERPRISRFNNWFHRSVHDKLPLGGTGRRNNMSSASSPASVSSPDMPPFTEARASARELGLGSWSEVRTAVQLHRMQSMKLHVVSSWAYRL